MSPLHWAVEREHMEVVGCLLRHGADMTKINKVSLLPCFLTIVVV